MPSFLKKPKADIALDVSSEPFYPGSTIKVGISISSQDRFTVRSGSVELSFIKVGWKTVSSGELRRKQQFKQKLIKVKKKFLANTEFSSGMTLNEQTSFVLPADVPPTVSNNEESIIWQLDVKLDVPKMRDIHEKRVITVLQLARW